MKLDRFIGIFKTPGIRVSRMELVTVLCSNLRPLVEPSLELQLNLLKEHIGIESFAAVYQ